MESEMPRYPQDRNHHEREERLDALGQMQIASPALQAIWAREDALRDIAAAERILARGYMTAIESYRVSAALFGKSPDEARAIVRARFDRDYAAAVAGEAIAA